MIYRKTDNPRCRTCKNSSPMDGTVNINCKLYGTRPADFVCKKYDYDIFKRQIKPKPKLKTLKFSKEDFEI